MLLFLSEGPHEKPSGIISVEKAIEIAKDHASQLLSWYIEEETLDLISAELWSVKEEDNYYLIGDTKIIYENCIKVIENDSRVIIRLSPGCADSYDSSVIYLNKKVPDKIWVVKFSCEGYMSHALYGSSPNQKAIRYKALINAENGEILDRLYRTRPIICGDEGFWERGEVPLKQWPKTCPSLWENVVKIFGRAENFTYPNRHSFTFTVEIISSVVGGDILLFPCHQGTEDPLIVSSVKDGKLPARCKIIGQIEELVENEPHFQRWVTVGSMASLNVIWEENPFVRIFGQKVGDNDIIDAYIIDVKVENQFRQWFSRGLLQESSPF